MKTGLPKFQVRESSSRGHFNVVNVRPENGTRWQVVGRAIDAWAAQEIAEKLNRQEAKIVERLKGTKP